MSNITTILIALVITKVIDFKHIEGLDIVIILLYAADVIIKLKKHFKGDRDGRERS